MKFLASLLLVVSFSLFTSCAHHGHHHGKRDCKDKKSCCLKDKKECKDKKKCDLKKKDSDQD